MNTIAIATIVATKSTDGMSSDGMSSVGTNTLALIARDGWDGPFPLIPLLFIVVWLTVWFTVGGRRRHRFDRRCGESVLAERYARGEIDEREYEQRRDVLRRQ